MRDPPLIAVKPDRPLDPASPVQHITACLGTDLAHQRLPRALAQPRTAPRLPPPAAASQKRTRALAMTGPAARTGADRHPCRARLTLTVSSRCSASHA